MAGEVAIEVAAVGQVARGPAEAVEIADRLAELEGMIEVRARPSTGSILCLHEEERLGADEIIDEVLEMTGVGQVRRRGQRQEGAADSAAGTCRPRSRPGCCTSCGRRRRPR